MMDDHGRERNGSARRSTFRVAAMLVAWAQAPSISSFVAARAGADEPLSPFVAETPPLSPAEQQTRFHVPPGFRIELVASEPEIRKPINLNFDAAGRLLVTGSIEYPFPAKGPPRDDIRALVDRDGDGRFDDVQVIVSGLNIPVGIAAVPGGLVAYNIPSVFRCDWTADHGRPSDPILAYATFDSADTHGMPNGFTYWIDGWIYACHGEGNRSTVAGRDGRPLTMRGGQTFRMRPDGSRIEGHAIGQANPFGLCFDAWGDLYTADSHSRPATLILRGATYPGPDAPRDALGFGPPLMSHHHESTGIGGIAFCAADPFPEAYRDQLLVGNPVTGRINGDRLVRKGSTYVAVACDDFLSCDDPWFRPVDVRLGPDGAIYIADFYNRIITHSLVPLRHAMRDRERGRIWRVSFERPDAEPGPRRFDLRGAGIDVLVEAMGHANLVVRTLATHEVVDRVGSKAIPPLRSVVSNGGDEPWRRAHAVWALHRLNALDDRLVARLADDPRPEVRVHLVRSLGERADWTGDSANARKTVLAALGDADALVRRAAADALGRHPALDNVAPLLRHWEAVPAEDTMLDHTIRIALRNSLLDGRTLEETARAAPESQRRRLTEIALAIDSPFSADFLLERLVASDLSGERLAEWVEGIARRGGDAARTRVIAYALARRNETRETQAVLLRSLDRGLRTREPGLTRPLEDWAHALINELLDDSDDSSVYLGLELAWDLRWARASERIERLASSTTPIPSLRSFAIDSLAAVSGEQATAFLERIVEDVREDLDAREKAADALAKSTGPSGRAAMRRQLPAAPGRVATALARGLAHTPNGAPELLDAIEQGAASARLLLDPMVETELHAHAIPDLETRIERLRAHLPTLEERRFDEIAARRTGFDPAASDAKRGADVFSRHCAACHAMNADERRAGPALKGIGRRGVDRLIEDILDPHRNVDAAYRASVVTRTDGRTVVGLVTVDDGRYVTLVDPDGRETRIARFDVETIERRPVSPMPERFGELLPAGEFNDLLAYLLR
ncbi:MAG: c-type cytochrome [Planctomycetes bacterium]|nr:c-type cytochrome [Planctomycetota bacterium]